MQKLFWLIPIFPLLGSAIIGLFGKKAGKTTVSAIAVGSVTLSFLLALIAMFAMRPHRDRASN